MFNLGFTEILLILGVALLVFGPSRLPQVGKSIGQAFREFKRAGEELTRSVTDDEPRGPSAPPVLSERPSETKGRVEGPPPIEPPTTDQKPG